MPSHLQMTLKCYKLILELHDSAQLQCDLAIWFRDWNMFFNTNKFIYLSFNFNFQTSYFVGNSTIQTSNSHCDLGIIISNNSSCKDHYNHIIAKAYRTLNWFAQTDFQPFNWHLNKESFVFSIGKVTITLLLSHMAPLPLMWHHCTWKNPTAGYQIHY